MIDAYFDDMKIDKIVDIPEGFKILLRNRNTDNTLDETLTFVLNVDEFLKLQRMTQSRCEVRQLIPIYTNCKEKRSEQ